MVPAMDEVGRRYEAEEYFVPELLLAARATSSFPGAFPPATITEIDRRMTARGTWGVDLSTRAVDAAARRLPELAGLGITAIELMRQNSELLSARFGSRFTEVENHVANFDFEAALATLEKLLANS